MAFERVSIHGGHSGQFCGHAQDSLEAVVRAYIDQGFTWIGLTEHMPPSQACFLYPEEREAGLTMADLHERFADYMTEARRLQTVFAGQIQILVGFETEYTTGAADLAHDLIDRCAPDYIVGSVHHVDDIPFDCGPAEYQKALAATGGITALYCRYFDHQYALIRRLKPQVVGHFDLIRIFDPDYGRQLASLPVQARIMRNLALIRDLNLILDFNVSAMRKGAPEPYLSRPLLAQARRMDIAVVPGDDAHGVATVGLNVDSGIRILQSAGFDGHWRKPAKQFIRPAIPEPI